MRISENHNSLAVHSLQGLDVKQSPNAQSMYVYCLVFISAAVTPLGNIMVYDMHVQATSSDT